ncbi:MAG: aldehyde dehydrogenase family protein [Ilumatobacteraceae bacterium]
MTAISPWNFPADAGDLEGGAGARVRQHRDPKPSRRRRRAHASESSGSRPACRPACSVLHGFGPGEAGEGLTTHAGVDLVTFTGESNTGRAIQKAVAPTLKRVSFEMGGKGANVVFADADLDKAVDWSIQAIFTNAGQVCLAGSRLYVQRPVYDEFLARFVERAESMRLGDPLDPATEIGPLASEEHWRKVTSYLDIAESEGAKILCGGQADGWWVKPTVLVNVDQEMRVCREEIFGPVVTVIPFDTEEEAVRLANDTPYGLNAMLFTENVRRAHRVAAALQAGTVWVNCFFIRDLRSPFGGFKQSGIGREGGKYSREFFTEPKAIIIEI